MNASPALRIGDQVIYYHDDKHNSLGSVRGIITSIGGRWITIKTEAGRMHVHPGNVELVERVEARKAKTENVARSLR